MSHKRGFKGESFRESDVSDTVSPLSAPRRVGVDTLRHSQSYSTETPVPEFAKICCYHSLSHLEIDSGDDLEEAICRYQWQNDKRVPGQTQKNDPMIPGKCVVEILANVTF